MKYPDYCFVDVAPNGWDSRNNIQTTDFFTRFLKSQNIGTNTSLKNIFRSQYRFEEDISLHVHAKGTISGYVGKSIPDFIYLDIDERDGGILGAVPKLREVLDCLNKVDVTLDRLVVSCTGSKGFSPKIPAGFVCWEPEYSFSTIVKRFVELIFPAEWIGRYNPDEPERNKNILIDAQIFDGARLWRIPNTLNSSRRVKLGDDRPRGFKVWLQKDEVLALLDQPELVFEYWKEPRKFGSEKEWLDGSKFWEFEPVPKLQELWQQAKDDTRNKKTVAVGDNSAKLSYVSTPAKLGILMPKAIKNMLDFCETGDPENWLSGRRNSFFWVLSTALYAYLPSIDLWRSMVHYTNSKLVIPMDNNELNSTLESIQRHEYSLPQDPTDIKFKIYQEFGGTSSKTTWADALQVFEMTQEYFAQGFSPIILGIQPWDQRFGGHQRKSIVVLVSYSGVGKTTLLVRAGRSQAPIAKGRDELVIFSSPEESLPVFGAYFAMQNEGVTPRRLYEMAADRSLNGRARRWSEDHQNHFVFDHIRGKSPSEIGRRLEEIRQKKGKSIMSVLMDSVTYLRPDPGFKWSSSSDKASSIVDGLNELADKFDCVLFLSVHLTKEETKWHKSKKDGGLVTDRNPGLYSGKGTTAWTDFAPQGANLYTRKSRRVIMQAPFKERFLLDGLGKRNEMTLPIPLIRDDHYMIHTIDEIERAYENPEELFNIDLEELREVAEFGEFEKERNNVN
jgi:hypothetical protein